VSPTGGVRPLTLTRAQQLFVGLAVLAILAAVVIGVRGRQLRPKAPPSADLYVPPAQPVVPSTITVQVAGAVHFPGLKSLPRGARVNDAVQAAGGPSAEADMDRVNLAAPVDDGERIDVPSRAASSAPNPLEATTAKPSEPQVSAARPLNLNTATAEQLEALPGVGPSLAQAIVGYRRQSGGFRRVEDLEAVPGIGPKRLADLRPYVVVQ
jgi:competence protein ComEA